MIWSLLLLVQAAAVPAEAEELGLRLARTGTLVTLAPVLAQKDLAELIGEHPELSEGDKQQLRATGQKIAAADAERIARAMGHSYARRLSVAELRELVAASESAAGRHARAVLPQVLAETMQGLGAIDFKGETSAAFCHDTGKLCATGK